MSERTAQFVQMLEAADHFLNGEQRAGAGAGGGGGGGGRGGRGGMFLRTFIHGPLRTDTPK